jgi:DNA-binding NarL/FixJ family response regulator
VRQIPTGPELNGPGGNHRGEDGVKRVLLVADELPVFEAVRGALRNGGVLRVAALADGRRPIAELLKTLRPDVVLIDEMQDHANAVARVRDVGGRPGVAAVVLVAAIEGPLVEEVYEAGANLVLCRTLHPVAFATILRETARGTVVLRPRAAPAARPDHGLTSRETEILGLVAEGFTNRQIARHLWITEQTVKFHVSNCYRKLGVGNRTQATRYAYTHALLATPEQQLAS